ncbi:MAG: histidine phosphatase family protein [Lachnospiraceae bacterium]|nr:histidine phosphatase family protein [Lachnospiraceae bacterium]
MEIYIVRHGETLWNKEKRLQGSVDIELSDYGRRVAAETGIGLKNTRIDRIYSSPLKRAYVTAELIRGDRDIPIITDNRLRELCFGMYEGGDFSALIRDETLTLRYFFKQPQLYVAPADGETLEALIARAGDFMREVIEPLAADKSNERVMIVAHGALNKAIMSYIKGHSLEHFWSGGLQSNCNVIIVDYSYEEKKYSIIDETRLFYSEDSL